MQPKIIDELENLLPMLKDEEYNGLLDSIRDNGQYEAIRVGLIDEEIIIDGHNRYRICKKLGIAPFFSNEIRVFEDIHEAKLWMINNQRERRNLNNFELAELAVLEREVIAEINKGKQGTRTDLCEDSVKNIAQNSAQCEERDRSENTSYVLAKKAGVSHDTINRVSKIMKKCSPDIISSLRAGELTINKAYSQVTNRLSLNTGCFEWYTPIEIVEVARAVLGNISLDPCSSETANEIVKADVFYTEEEDGLKKDWKGSIWMNPPYAQPLISQFCEKLVEHFTNGDVAEAITLTNNTTETRCAQALLSNSSAICLLGKRVKFIDGSGKERGTPLQGQMICYLGEDCNKFEEEFGKLGTVFYKTV